MFFFDSNAIQEKGDFMIFMIDETKTHGEKFIFDGDELRLRAIRG